MKNDYFEAWDDYRERRKDSIHPEEEAYMKDVLERYDGEMLNFVLSLLI